MLLNSLLFIVLRQIRKVHYLLILLSVGVLGFLECLAVAAAVGVLALPVGLRDCLLTYVALPAVGYSTEVCIMLSFKFEEASRVALIGTTGVVFSFMLQFVVFGVPPDAYSVGGGVIVIFGVFVTACRKWVGELPLEDNRREKFKFLLI